jgi:hypothetical protein
MGKGMRRTLPLVIDLIAGSPVFSQPGCASEVSKEADEGG